MPNEEKEQNIPEAVEENALDAVMSKIYEANNILIALSADPSVDELAAAIGLSIFFDKMGKRATAIYSGATPNALEFLNPEKQFTNSTDALQDFVVAIDKDKADHLRYKVDGNYVKVYITPYGSKISEEDLEFSYGDYNVDLIVALDVANGIDLDEALREHGRIMHDAAIVNITVHEAGKFGEIEWSDPSMSSISEMAATLSYAFGGDFPVGKDEATAYLTGIVAATARFSNEQTTPATMLVASKLMKSGANQQLIAKNVMDGNEVFKNLVAQEETMEELPPKSNPEAEMPEAPAADDGLLDLKDIEDSFKEIPAVEEPIANAPAEAPAEVPALEDPSGLLPDEPAPAPAAPVEPEPMSIAPKQEMIIDPPAELNEETLNKEKGKYGEMMTEELGDNNPAAVVAPIVSTEAEAPATVEMDYNPVNDILPPPPAPVIPGMPVDEKAPAEPVIPAAPAEPTPLAVPEAPVMSAVPEAPVEPEVPAAPITPIEPAQPVPEPAPSSLGPQPAMQDQVYSAPANDPSAFRIPGM